MLIILYQTQVFAADGAVAESSQSGTPQGEGVNRYARTQTLSNTELKIFLYTVTVFSHFSWFLDLPLYLTCPVIALSLSLASTPEEMREEKKEQEGEKGASSEESRAAKAKASKPLMPTSTILRLLAELVRSYVGIATLITSYNYTAGQSELIKEVRHIG